MRDREVIIPVGVWQQTNYSNMPISSMPVGEARKAARGGRHSLEKWARKRGFNMRTARLLAGGDIA